jgi:hypothetical protein
MYNEIYKPPRAELYDKLDILEEELNDQTKVLASGFKMVLYALYTLVASIVFIVGDENIMGIILFVGGAGLFVFGIISIGIGEKNSITLGLLYLILSLIPILNCVSLAIILKRAALDLRKNSYQVKLWGVKRLIVQDAKSTQPSVLQEI